MIIDVIRDCLVTRQMATFTAHANTGLTYGTKNTDQLKQKIDIWFNPSEMDSRGQWSVAFWFKDVREAILERLFDIELSLVRKHCSHIGDVIAPFLHAVM